MNVKPQDLIDLTRSVNKQQKYKLTSYTYTQHIYVRTYIYSNNTINSSHNLIDITTNHDRKSLGNQRILAYQQI